MFRSGAPGLVASASASPSHSPVTPTPLHVPTSVAGVSRSTEAAASWLDSHWAGWAEGMLKIVVIVLLSLVLRAVVRKMIAQVIARMTRHAEHEAGEAGLLGGLLANHGVITHERRRQRSEAIGSVLRSVASFSILGTAALMVISALGLDLAPLLASAGVAGVAIGFGARNLVTDFLSGVFMIMEDQYGVGDEIDTGVATGTVLEVGLRVTKLRGASGEIWYIRNGEVKRIANLSQGWSTATVDVQVGYRENLDRVEELIRETAEALAKESPWDELIWEPAKMLGVESVAAESVTVRIEVRTAPGKAALVTRGLRQRLKASFDLAGIRIKEEATTAAARPAAPDTTAAPSALSDPNSAKSLSAKPIPLPSPAHDAVHSLDDPTRTN